MYLQITTRCNMTCKHCGFACTKNGKDMNIKTFHNALDKIGDEVISIGGGEPTLHKRFWQILCETRAQAESTWLATNGSITKISLTLAEMAKTGFITCELSIDDYHDPIDPKVIKAFEEIKIRDGDQTHIVKGVRNVTGREINAGRCNFGEDGCICEDVIIAPDGTVKLCACQDSPILGNVNDKGFDLNYDKFQVGTCYKGQEYML